MTPAAPAPNLLDDPAFPAVKAHVIARTGLAYYADKDADLARHVAGRLAALELPGCIDYLALLGDEEGQAEFDELVKQLTIGETFFFRHAELFAALRATVLPDLLARNRAQRRLRIWSAGCSTGAEAYSLSILLRRDLAFDTAGWDVSIIATDINRDFLVRAERAVFDEWALRATPEDVRRECFRREGSSWALEPRFTEGVSFQYHNLVTNPFPSQLNNLFAFDLILCRNVLIYFDQEQIRRALDGFHRSLVDGGWLLVGHAEPSIELFRAYRTVNDAGAVLYQKAPADATLPPVYEPPQLPPAPAFAELYPPAPPSRARSKERKRQPAATDLTAVRSLADRGEWDQALAGCRDLIAAEPLDPQAHLCNGLILEQVGRHDAAEEALRRAIYLDRRFALAHYYLGLLLHKGHRPQDAARSFRNALTLLDRLAPDHAFADGDGITAAELAGLARMQLDILGVGVMDIESVFRARAVELAAPRDSREQAGALAVLAFALGGERYALPLADLGGVLPFGRCTPVPGGPAELVGLINHRGRIRCVLDLARLLGLPGADPAFVLLLRRPGREVGLMVGAVEGLLRVPASGGRPGEGPAAPFVVALTPDRLQILGADAILSHPVLTKGDPQ